MISCLLAAPVKTSLSRKWESWPSSGRSAETNRNFTFYCPLVMSSVHIENKASDKNPQGEAALPLWLHDKRRGDCKSLEDSGPQRLFGHVWLGHGKQVFSQQRGKWALMSTHSWPEYQMCTMIWSTKRPILPSNLIFQIVLNICLRAVTFFFIL